MSQPKFDGSGKFEEFKANLMAYYFTSGTRDEVQKQSVLIASLSKEIFQELQESCVVRTTPTRDLLYRLEKLYSTNSSDFNNRHKFYSAIRTPKEKPQNWAARLVGLASNCKFEDGGEMLVRDLFISRYRAGQVQNRLLEENPKNPEVDLHRLVELATMKENELLTANVTPKAEGGKPKARVTKTSAILHRTQNWVRSPKPEVKPSKTLKTGVRTTKPKTQRDQPTAKDITGQLNWQHVTGVKNKQNTFEAKHMSVPSSSNTYRRPTTTTQNANRQTAKRQIAYQDNMSSDHPKPAGTSRAEDAVDITH